MHPIDDSDQAWFVFSSQGVCSLVHGDTIKKALAIWKKSPASKRAEVVGILKSGGPVTIDNARMQSTQIYGVVCCVHEKEAK